MLFNFSRAGIDGTMKETSLNVLDAIIAIENNAATTLAVDRDPKLYAAASMLSTRPNLGADLWENVLQCKHVQITGESVPVVMQAVERLREKSVCGYPFPDVLNQDDDVKPDFPDRVFPEYIENYVDMACKSNQVPRALVGSGVLATTAGAVQGRYAVQTPDNYHIEQLPLYIVALGSPSARKSSALQCCIDPVIALQRAQKALDYRKKLAEVRQERKAIEAKQRGIERLIERAAGKDESAVQSLTAELKKCGDDLSKLKIPENPLYFYDNITVEALAERMADSQELAFIASAEAGSLDNFAGIYGKDGKASLDLLNKAKNAEFFKVNRKTGSTETILQAPLLSMIFMIQPKIFADIQKNERLEAAGFLARMLVCQIPERTTPLQAKSPCNFDKRLYNEYEATIQYFSEIPRPSDRKAKLLKFDDDAAQVIQDFRQSIFDELVTGGRYTIDDSLEFVAGKVTGDCQRIAAILHLLENPVTETKYNSKIDPAMKPISKRNAENAVRIARYYLDGMTAQTENDAKRLRVAEQKILEKIFARTIFSCSASCSMTKLKHDVSRNKELSTNFDELVSNLANSGCIEVVTTKQAGRKSRTDIFPNPYLVKKVFAKEIEGLYANGGYTPTTHKDERQKKGWE